MLELSLQDRRTEEDRRTKRDRMTKRQIKTEGQKEKRQKEIYSVYMALLRPSTESTSEIYSNCATSCCTIELNSNVSYEIMKSMVLDTSYLLSFLRISILLSLLSLESTR
jgi:hypothetical protein